jgi:hypothetical protein
MHADDGGAEQKGDETMARDYMAVKIADPGVRPALGCEWCASYTRIVEREQ